MNNLPCFSQKEAQIWYFGRNAGLDFNTNPPTALTNGQVNTREGVSAISDKTTGQLLFYSEGTTAWNRNHAIMPNGSGLLGDYSSTQSSVAVPNPGNSNKYYLFTTALLQGMRYSEVDMTLQGGLGDVVAATKNSLLIPTNASSEKLIAVQHCNKKDYWVVTHTINSNTFYVYLVTAAGIQPPVTYNIGYSIGNATYWEATGYLKFSPDGTKLAHVIGPGYTGALSTVELLSFNNQTGILAGPVTSINNLNSPYGAEFSQSSRYLYISELLGRKIFQYDLTDPSLNITRYQVTSSPNLLFGALQLGPDNKIYVSAENGYNTGYGYLGVINNPEISGTGCGYVQDAINLNGKTALIGLPTFNATFLQKDTASVRLSGNCSGNSIAFSLTNTNNTDSVKWDFGDASDSSMLLTPAHTYALPGNYNTQVIIYRSCLANDTISKTITISNCNQAAVVASFNTPDTVCIDNPVNITNTTTGATNYYWNFCVADINKTPVGTNLGNPGGNLTMPVFMDYAFYNGNYYGFVVNFNPGSLIRLDFGNSLLNTPTSINLGNFGGILPTLNSAEGLRVVQNEGRWYVIMVGGYAGGPTPRVLKIDFGPNLNNTNPVATDWGNLGNMNQPIDFDIFQDNNNNWYGFTINANNNTVTRFNFTNSFNNTPTAVNLGNVGNLAYPTGIYIANDNGNYRVFITNAGDNTRNTGTFSLTRLDFGNSLLNTPIGVNLGNPGNLLQHPRDFTIMKSCGQTIGFAVNGHLNNRDIIKLDFNGDLSMVPTATSLGNIGNLSFAHSISRLFRVNEDIYSFVTNVDNNTITRLRFTGCNNASIPNSTAQNPPPVVYNTPGTYNINLTIDDGLPTQSATCRQVEVMAAPVAAVTQQKILCSGNTIRIGTGTKYATYTWNTGAATDSIDINSPGTYWVQINRFGCSVTDTIVVTGSSCIVNASFTAPDTVCINNPVTITNTSIGATSYYWNFCVADITKTPTAVNIGNIGGNLSQPVFMDYVFTNGNYYGFVTNHIPGALTRLDFGNSLLNTPTSVNLGNFGGIIPAGNGTEGIQVVQNEGKWYAIIVGGSTLTAYPPRVLKISFGTNITNPAPTATDWGNLGNMTQPIDFDLFKENNNWYGFTVNALNNTITRFNFTNSFENTPTAVNMGNLGGLDYPTGIYTINDNGNYRVFISNAGNVPSLTRLDFGSSLLNTPAAVNLGNPGNFLSSPRDLTIMRSCGQIAAFVVVGRPGFANIVRYDFNNDLSSIPVPASLGNIGNLDFPHSISRLFRVNEDIFGFVTNVTNNTITRLRFAGCNNSSIPSSTAETPPPIKYNTPGVYNINLTVDDGLPTQNATCKQVVVLPAPVAGPTQERSICKGQLLRIGTGNKYGTYLWNTGATTDSIDVNAAGTYWVEVNSFGCKATDTFKITQYTISDFGFKQDVCNPYNVQFFNAGTATANPWWSFGDGNIVTGSLNLPHVYPAFGDYTVRFSVRQGVCVDTVTKVISINVVKDDMIITPDTVVCNGATKQLRTKPALSFCWSPTTYLSDPNSPNPVTSTPNSITYYFNAEVPGNNLIINGDFSASNTGFTSGYNYTLSNITEGEYSVGTNPQAWNASLSNCIDHTTGKGNMMLVNGSPVAGVGVWTQTITVMPNTNYAFSTWIQALYPPNPAILSFSINGKDIGSPITATLPTCTWSQFYITWNSGNNTTATIAIVNRNTQIQGNDFALDDISFAPVLIKRDSVVITIETPIVKTNKDTTICAQHPVPLNTTGAVQYTWTPQAGLSNTSIANPIASPAVNTSYIVTGTTIHGCVAKDTVEVAIFAKPTITRTQDTAVCRNSALPLLVSGGQSYSWSPATGLSNPSIPNPVASLGTTESAYTVKITDIHSCDYFESIKLAIRPYPVFGASGNKAICFGSPTTLQASGGDAYQWTPAGLLDDPNAQAPVTNPDITTQYSVYISENTCHFDTTINMTVRVNPLPELTVQKANDINCNTPSTQLKASGALQYTWSPATGLDNPDIANPVSTADSSIVYLLEGTNEFGCTASTEVPVAVTKDGIPRFVVPNAFTPNGDGNNDCFGIKRWGNARIEEFSVFNRWGQLVFKTNTPSQCWDGRFNGKLQDAGAYVYIIKAKTLCGEITRKGIVMLVR